VLRDQGLLGAMVPAVLGGSGASLATVAAICKVLGETCASTGMIYAMHQIQVACLLDHGTGSAWHQHLLARMAGEQLLLASATSEEAIGGALRSSGCAVNVDGDRFHLLKMAPTISYGAHADGILITARRNADASPSDQVLVCALKSDYTLQSLNTWDTLGMRGTCSNGFRLEATGQVDQVLPVPFGEIADATMTPVSHILWSALWLGIASDAVSRAKTFFQGQARARPGQLPPSASRVAEAVSLLQMMEGARGSGAGASAQPPCRRIGVRRIRAGGRDERAEDGDVDDGAGSGAAGAAGVRHGGLQARHAVQPGAPPARPVVRAADDQQRSHPDQHGQPAAGRPFLRSHRWMLMH
jgi:acyl-CoA dehydrogenase